MKPFNPLPPDHPAVGMSCYICNQSIKAGDITCLIPTEPADDEENEKMLAGRPYNSKAEIAHWTCATELDLDKLIE